MSSFNRADYEAVYAFARRVFVYNFLSSDGSGSLLDESTSIMNLCEDVIGQQDDFPIEARRRRKKR